MYEHIHFSKNYIFSQFKLKDTKINYLLYDKGIRQESIIIEFNTSFYVFTADVTFVNSLYLVINPSLHILAIKHNTVHNRPNLPTQ